MKRYLPLALIVVLLIAFRVLGALLPEYLPNFQPLAAVFFCGALLAPHWRGLAIPCGVWALTYPLGIGHTGSWSLFLGTLAAYLLIFALGKLQSQHRAPALLAGSIAAALLFHSVTGTLAWLMDPRYVKTLGGLWQSLWAGAPGDALPSWVFLRNLTLANGLFTALFLAARFRLAKPQHISVKEGLAAGL